MKINPTVCAVGKNYQIMIVLDYDALVSVRIGQNVYYNHSNGIRISSAGVHRISVPITELDRECSYTVIIQKMVERCTYFPKTEPEIEMKYNFKPISKESDINIYHLADVHGMGKEAIGAAKYIGKDLDLLIMNGDISSSSDTFEDMTLVYIIASEITKGEIPCVISRGNHDLRGFGAERLAEYMPGDNGKSYYTFTLGCIWGILIDTGEDKNDDHPEYGGTVCCHNFRLEQDEMIKKVIENASLEYAKEKIKYKFIISHVPFTFKEKEPFDIERELYSSWAKLMRDNINPSLMLCGHTHEAVISECGSEYDDLGQPCTVVVGSELKKGNDGKDILAGAYINLSGDKANIVFNTENKVLDEAVINI